MIKHKFHLKNGKVSLVVLASVALMLAVTIMSMIFLSRMNSPRLVDDGAQITELELSAEEYSPEIKDHLYEFLEEELGVIPKKVVLDVDVLGYFFKTYDISTFYQLDDGSWYRWHIGYIRVLSNLN